MMEVIQPDKVFPLPYRPIALVFTKVPCIYHMSTGELLVQDERYVKGSSWYQLRLLLKNTNPQDILWVLNDTLDEAVTWELQQRQLKLKAFSSSIQRLQKQSQPKTVPLPNSPQLNMWEEAKPGNIEHTHLSESGVFLTAHKLILKHSAKLETIYFRGSNPSAKGNTSDNWVIESLPNHPFIYLSLNRWHCEIGLTTEDDKWKLKFIDPQMEQVWPQLINFARFNHQLTKQAVQAFDPFNL